MKNLYILLFIFITQLSYGQTKKDTNNIFTGDTTIAIIHYNSLYEQYKTYIFGKSKEAILTTSEIAEIEVILNKCIDEYNTEKEKELEKQIKENKAIDSDREFSIIKLKKYKRQYIAIINDKGEKEVYLNCFCNSFHPDWKKDLVMVLDGGKCYFNLRINLKSKKNYQFSVNGDA